MNINMARVRELYDYLGMYQAEEESITNDWEHDYLTCNQGSDGDDYYWYMDESLCAAINVNTGAILGDEEDLARVLYMDHDPDGREYVESGMVKQY